MVARDRVPAAGSPLDRRRTGRRHRPSPSGVGLEPCGRDRLRGRAGAREPRGDRGDIGNRRGSSSRRAVARGDRGRRGGIDDGAGRAGLHAVARMPVACPHRRPDGAAARGRDGGAGDRARGVLTVAARGQRGGRGARGARPHDGRPVVGARCAPRGADDARRRGRAAGRGGGGSPRAGGAHRDDVRAHRVLRRGRLRRLALGRPRRARVRRGGRASGPDDHAGVP